MRAGNFEKKRAGNVEKKGPEMLREEKCSKITEVSFEHDSMFLSDFFHYMQILLFDNI